VKTIGDDVMATFIRPEHALSAGLRMRAAMKKLNTERGKEDLIVKIGIHEGPCLAVTLNERQDYFGQTVNIAARVQSLSTSQEIHLTQPVMESAEVAGILDREAIKPIQKEAALRGIADKLVVYEIP
jgi:class 3 adenylate cyclase